MSDELSKMMASLKKQFEPAPFDDQEVTELLSLLTKRELNSVTRRLEKSWGIKGRLKWSEWIDTKTGKIKKNAPKAKIAKMKSDFRKASLQYYVNKTAHNAAVRLSGELPGILRHRITEFIDNEMFNKNVAKDEIFQSLKNIVSKANKEMLKRIKEVEKSLDAKNTIEKMKARPKFGPFPSSLANKLKYEKEKSNGNN